MANLSSMNEPEGEEDSIIAPSNAKKLERYVINKRTEYFSGEYDDETL